MIVLVVNGQNYSFPTESDPPPWGSLVTDWATAVTGVLGEIVGVGDIIQTSSGIINNNTSPAAVSGLIFSSATVRGAIVDYTIYRVTTGSGATELSETGQLYINYKNTANTWQISNTCGGNAGVVFSITNGQVLYTSSNITGLSYSGVIHFRAAALSQ